MTPAARPAITGIVNDATFTAGGAISPGAWVAIFGTGLAPAGDSRKWNEATEIVNAQRVASSGKSWWRLSRTRFVQQAMSNGWFAAQGLVSLVLKYDSLRR